MDFLKAVNIIRRDLEEAKGLLEQLSGMSGSDLAAVELARSRITSASSLLGVLHGLVPAAAPSPVSKSPAEPAASRPAPAQGEAAEPAVSRPAPAQGEAAEPAVSRPAPLEGSTSEPAVSRPAPAEGSTSEPVSAEAVPAAAPETEGRAAARAAGNLKKEKEAAHAILADRFQQGGTLGEKISNGRHDELVSSVIHARPVTDIADAIGMNDRFYFIRELFSGDSAAYSDTIRRLNGAASLGEAMKILDESTVMGSDPAAQSSFVEVVRRKFSLNV